MPEAVDRSEGLRFFPEWQLVRLRETRAERELCVHTVDAGDVRIADEVRGAVAGEERTEPSQRAAFDVDAGCSENDVVRVERRRIGNFGIQRLAFAVKLLERLEALCERTARAFDAPPGRAEVDRDQDRDRALTQRSARPLREDCAAAEREDVRLGPLEHLARDLLLQAAKPRLALQEELHDGCARAAFDLVVEVEKRSPDAQGDLRRKRRLARAHEADERDVPLQRL